MQMLAATIVSAAIAFGVSQDLSPTKGTSRETAHLTIATSASADAAAPGQKVGLRVDVSPKEKMHVYAPGQDGYISVSLKLDPDPAFTVAKPKYPAGEKLFMAALNETQIVYSKPFRIDQDITIARTPAPRDRAKADAAAVTIKGTLRYQACDDRICYLPANIPVEWTVRLSPPK